MPINPIQSIVAVQHSTAGVDIYRIQSINQSIVEAAAAVGARIFFFRFHFQVNYKSAEQEY